MSDSKISVRYSKAFIETSREKDILEAVKTDMDFIGQCLNQVPEFKMILDSPVIRTSEKRTLFKKSIGENIHPVTLSFIDLIFTNRRENCLGSIIRYFIYLYNKEIGIKPALLQSPVKLDPALRDKIIHTISQKLNIKMELQVETNPQLLGGFIMRIEDYQIDASIASQLVKIKKELTQ
jgi:F-type H+-transporting ATPase subunit delta